jgi:hypothetical protein
MNQPVLGVVFEVLDATAAGALCCSAVQSGQRVALRQGRSCWDCSMPKQWAECAMFESYLMLVVCFFEINLKPFAFH